MDIVIALDTTGSMTPSIENARRDARKIVGETRQRLPNARFTVVQFRDAGDRPEFEVLVRSTASAEEVEAATRKMEADGGDDAPEAYNLVFQKAAEAPAEMGFREGARKIMFVIGDAEPHGAGTAGLAGCADDSRDPHRLDTAKVLAAMRAAEVTLNLVLQRSSASTTLKCYQSLAAAAYGNGEASESGEAGGGGCSPRPAPRPPEPTPSSGAPGARAASDPPSGEPCPSGGGGGATSDEAAAAPIAGAVARGLDREFPSARLALRRGSGWRSAAIVLRNPGSRTARLGTVTLRLPRGAAARAAGPGATIADGVVRWRVDRDLAPGARHRLALQLRVSRSGRARVSARFRMADGGGYTARETARLTGG